MLGTFRHLFSSGQRHRRQFLDLWNPLGFLSTASTLEKRGSLELEEVQKILSDVKADDVRVIHVGGQCDWTDHIVIATGRSTWHVKNIAQALLHKVSERHITRIPDSVHKNNQYERDVTERCIIETGKTLQAVLSEWFAKFINKEIDMSKVQMNHPEAITAKTPLCNCCYEKLVDHLLYWFRITLPPHLFPPDVAGRENCWYGYACRTQHHNSEHAMQRNHVCRQTKGTPI